jgi:ethanolamine utilization protein EutQ (cupin superfamily)
VPPELVSTPTVVEAAGTPPKRIEELIEFDEYTVVLSGELEARHRAGVVTVKAGEAVIARAGEWVQYATPNGAQYIAVCLPAFAPDIVHRDA